jgi:tetratricopeptide (TPR) repeat protein
VFQSELKGIKGLRLEALADSRLPNGGPGWAPGDGNFVLNEVTLHAAPAKSPDKARAIALRNASADFSQGGWDVRGAVDGNAGTGWAISPNTNKDHTAVFELAEESGDGQTARLTVRLNHQFSDPSYKLGRFRLSVTNDATTLQATRIRLDRQDSEVADLHLALGKAYSEQGQTKEAVSSFTAALALAADRAGKARIIAEAAPLKGALEKLAERAAGDWQFQAELARHYAERGNAPLANPVRAKARALIEERLAREPKSSVLNAEFAQLLMDFGHTREAVGYLTKASSANPENTILSLKVAAFQAWFGQEKELAATRRRILAFARGTNDAGTAEQAAKSCSILPSTDKAELEAALALGRTGVRLDKSSEWRDWRLLGLGMAEYRSGNDEAADEALRAAAQAGPNNTHATGISAFYRAMSLFRQSKHDEARKLAIAAAAKMKPLPTDENNPLAGNDTYDDLILWLAYKEAKAVIKFDAAPPPKAKYDKK